MNFFEINYNCAFLCAPPGLNPGTMYYIFSNVNTTPVPTTFCFEQIYDFIDSYAATIYIVCFISGGYLLLNFILATCLCCHPDKKKGLPVYTRMSYT